MEASSPSPPSPQQQQQQHRKPRVLLGLSGSVATIKAVELTKQLLAFADVRVVHTQAAAHFVNKDTAQLVSLGVAVLCDADEWSSWTQLLDPVLHIELRKWADVFVIAPLSANSLAKLATGLSDNLLTCVARAWDLEQKPLLVAPAMNTMMWAHPVTGQHIKQLQAWNVEVIAPIAKKLACGDTGLGAMASVATIVKAVRRAALGPHRRPTAATTLSVSNGTFATVAVCVALGFSYLFLLRRPGSTS